MNGAGLVLDAVSRLYAAVTSPEQWSPALAAVSDALRGEHALIHVNDAENGALAFAATFGLDARDQERLRTREALEWAATMSAAVPVNVAFSTGSVWPDRDLERLDYYNYVLRPTNGFYAAAAVQTLPSGVFSLGICRPRRAGDYDATEIDMLQQLLPHLTMAVDLHQRLRAAERRYESLSHLLDRLDTGVILTDAAGRPVFVNACALQLAAGRDGLTLDDAGMRAMSPDATRRLQEAITSVGADRAASERRLRLQRPSRRPPLLLSLLPVSRLDAAVPGMRTPRVAVFISEPDAPVAVDDGALSEAFGLTRRESDVATLLASGLALPEIATELGIGLGATRQYLKRALSKSDTHSQAALVALVRGFVDPRP